MARSKLSVVALESIEIELSRLKHLAALQFSTSTATLWPFLNRSKRIDYRTFGIKRGICDDTELFPNFKITQFLINQKIDAVYLSGHSNLKIEKWSQSNKIAITSINFSLQRDLENKIFFDKLLKRSKIASPKSVILKTRTDLEDWQSYPAVLQVPESHGGLGTFIVRDLSQAEALIAKRRLKYPLLLREFMPGIACGVTLILSKRRLVVSALRAQCSLTQHSSSNFYYGIQWLPHSFLKGSNIRQLQNTIEDLANLMRQLGVLGSVHFDLMLSSDGVRVIECNPRPSGAAPQLSCNPILLHGLDFSYEHANSSLGGELSGDYPSIPRTSFSGCTIDFDFALPKIAPKTLKRSTRVAGWVKQKATQNSRCFIYPYHPKGAKLTPQDTLGVLLSPRPFFRLDLKRIDFRKGACTNLNALARWYY